MAKNSIRDYDATAANNTDVQSTDISEGCSPAGINNAIREVMADIKDVSTGTVSLETPAADRLDVDNLRLDGNTISSTDTNGDITIDPDGTGDTIIASGNVGIGVSTASGKLHLSESGAINKAATIFSLDGTDSTFGANLAKSSGTYTTPAVNLSGGGWEYQPVNSANNHGAMIYLSAPDTNTSAATPLERLRIDSSGNVGIGIAPASVLHVQGADPTVTIQDTNDTGDAFIKFKNNSGTQRGFIQTAMTSNVMLFGTGTTERMRIDSSGNLLVGTTSTPNGTADGVQIQPTSGANRFSRGSTNVRTQVTFYNPNGLVGAIQTSGSSTSYVTSSDYRLKENAVDMTGAITRVKSLQPKRFNFIADDSTTVDGFMAHEAATVVPESVIGTHNEVETWTQDEIDAGDAPANTNAGDNKLDGDGNTVPVYQGIDQSKLVPLLTGALQEAIAKIETLETKVAALENA